MTSTAQCTGVPRPAQTYRGPTVGHHNHGDVAHLHQQLVSAC